MFYYRNNGQICLYKTGVGDLQTCNTGIVPNKYVDVKIVMNGSNYKVYINGSKAASLDVTDALYSLGYLSFRTQGTDCRFDKIVIQKPLLKSVQSLFLSSTAITFSIAVFSRPVL